MSEPSEPTEKSERYTLRDKIAGLGESSIRKNYYPALRHQEERLREFEELHSAVFNFANDAIFIHEAETGKIIEINSRAEEMFQCSREEIFSLGISGLSANIAPYTEQHALNWIAKASKGIPQVFEWLARKLNGDLFWLEVSMRVALIGEKKRVFVVTRDITERKAHEGALQAQEQFLNNMFNSLQDGISVQDREFNIVRTNHFMEQRFTHKQPLVGRKCFSAYFEQNETCRWCPMNQVLESGETQTVELPIYYEAGVEGWIHLSVHPIRDEKGEVTGTIEYIRDVTAWKKAEIALLDTEREYRQLVESANSIILRMSSAGKITFMNPYGLKLFGYTKEELIGQSPIGTIVPSIDSDGNDLQQMIDSICKYPERFTTNENENICKNGDRLWIAWANTAVYNKNGDFIEVLSIGNDLTAHRKMELDRDRLGLAIEQAAEAVVITDVNGVIQYVNPAFEITTGYIREEIIGKKPNILKSGKQSQKFYKNLWGTLLSGKPWRGRFINKKKDGSLFTEDSVISPVFDKSGKIVNFVSVRRDITEEINLEDQLRHSQKMEAIGLLAGGVAHDFNNLLQAILGYSEMALENANPDSKLHEYIQEVLHAADSAKVLVSQLLAFSRRQVLKLEELDIEKVINDLAKMLRRVIGDHIILNIRTRSQINIVRADRGQIEQVLMNLCVNSRDAMPDGGEISITTENANLSNEFCRNKPWAKPGNYIRISVQDTGTGMDNETLDRVFEPFFTTKLAGKGTGLGLATVYGIVSQHNGLLNVQSTLGQGTEFYIYFPISEISANETNNNIEKAPKGGTETILIAEDNETVRELAVLLLTKAGYTVLQACDGAQALELLKQHKNTIDLAIIDILMPRIGGRAVFEKMYEANYATKVIFASGYSGESDFSDFIAKSGVPLLQKPFERDTLLRCVRKTLES